MAIRLFLLALLVCACSFAQDGPASEVAVFRSGVQLAVVQFHVTSSNRYVPGLTAADFLLVEDGRHVPISVFENGSLEGEALPVEVDPLARQQRQRHQQQTAERRTISQQSV